MKNAKMRPKTVLGVELSVNWFKRCGFFRKLVIIRGGMVRNNVRVVRMLKDWGKYWKIDVKGTYPETKPVLVRELTGELFLCVSSLLFFKVNTWGFYGGEGGCEVRKFYRRKSKIKSKGEQGKGMARIGVNCPILVISGYRDQPYSSMCSPSFSYTRLVPWTQARLLCCQQSTQ